MTKAPAALRSIGEVSAELGIETSTLRYWEREFGRLHPTRSASGRRFYRPTEIILFKAIRHLVRVERYTVAGARRYVSQKGFMWAHTGAQVTATAALGAPTSRDPVSVPEPAPGLTGCQAPCVLPQ